MITTILLAKFWGVLLVTIGVLYLLRKELIIKVIESGKDEKYSLTAGFMVLIIGIVTFLLAPRYEIILKLLGLFAYLKGIALIVSPKWRYNIVKRFENNSPLLNIVLVLCILLGIYLLWSSGHMYEYLVR